MFVCVDDNQGISKAQAESGCALPENKEARVRIEIVHLSALITSICALSRERASVSKSPLGNSSSFLPSAHCLVAHSRVHQTRIPEKEQSDGMKNHRLTYERACFIRSKRLLRRLFC